MTRSLTLKHLVVPFSSVMLDRSKSKGDRLYPTSPSVLGRDVDIAGHAFPLIIVNSPMPPAWYKYVLFAVDVVVEQTNHDLAIWFLLHDNRHGDDEYSDITARVVWTDGHQSIIRASAFSRDSPTRTCPDTITGYALFEGRAGSDVADIILSVGDYRNPNRYQLTGGFSWSAISGKVVKEPTQQPLLASVQP